MSEPILLGERLRIEVPNLKPTSGGTHDAVAWIAEKDQISGSKINLLNIGTRHCHFGKLTTNAASDICELVSFKTAEGLNMLRHDSNSSGVDEVLRYGVAYTLRCLTRSKAGGRYLSPNNDALAWDRHAEALRTDVSKAQKKAEAEDDGNDPEPINEMFRVIHLVATNMRRDWQEDLQAAGNPLVPTSRFGLVNEKRLKLGKPAFVASNKTGTALTFVPELGQLCVFIVRRVQLDEILNANGLLSSSPVTSKDSNFDSDEDERDARRRSSSAAPNGQPMPAAVVQCQTYSHNQWVARKGDSHFVTVDNSPIKNCKDFVPWWTGDGLGHWRVSVDANDNDGDGDVTTDHEGWMYGTSYNRMFHPTNASTTSISNHKYRIRKWELLDAIKLQEYHPILGTGSGELNVPRWRIHQDDVNGGSGIGGVMNKFNSNSVTANGDGGGEGEGGVGGRNENHDDGGFQHAPLTPSKPTLATAGAEQDKALELEYMSLKQGDASLKKTHVQNLKGWEGDTFEKLDQDGDGSISLQEFKALAVKTGVVQLQQSSVTTSADISTVWAGQALLPPCPTWEGRVVITNKWNDSNDSIIDYAVDQAILMGSLVVEGVQLGDKKIADVSSSLAADFPGESKGESKRNKMGGKKHNNKKKEEKRKKIEERKKKEDDVSNGRQFVYAKCTLNVNTKKMELTVDGDDRKNIIIDIHKSGLSIDSIKEEIVAERSLKKDVRIQSTNDYDSYVKTIAKLQERRKNLPPNNKSAKKKINIQIDEQLLLKNKERYQMLGRQKQQGWLRLRLRLEDEKHYELIFSPIEDVSSFFISDNENEIGKKENYQNHYEICRSILIDSMQDTYEMREIISNDLQIVMSKLASMKQFTTTNGAVDIFNQFSQETKGMGEIDERINSYQKQQRQVLQNIKHKIQEIQDGNLVSRRWMLLV
jgi:hypothetical protein